MKSEERRTKNICLITASLALFTLHFSFFAPQAHAQNYAISPSVLLILDRADAAIEDAEGDVLLTFFADGLAGWSREALQAVAGSTGVQTGVIDRGLDMLQQTACLRVDVVMIERKMEEVRALLTEALEDRSVIGVIRLSDLYAYLAERRTELLRGALDPTIRDEGALAIRPAGPDNWEEEMPEGWEDGVCHFHSDYLPPSLAGYGCDVEALRSIQERLPAGEDGLQELVAKEEEAITAVQSAMEEHLSGARTLQEITDAIDAIALGDAPRVGATAPRVHTKAQGCMQAIPSGAVGVAKRGNFSTEPDELRLLREFVTQRERRETGRPFSPIIAVPADSESSAGEGDDDFFSLGFWTNLLLKEPRREDMLAFTRQQARDEARIFAVSGDPVLEIERTFLPLRNSVGSLSSLASGVNGGLRGFVRDFAYFLLRTCMERPCREKLERVTRIVLADECFPYVGGEYLQDTCRQPRWQKCEYAAYEMGDPPDVECEEDIE